MASHDIDPENEAKTVPSVHKVMGAVFWDAKDAYWSSFCHE